MRRQKKFTNHLWVLKNKLFFALMIVTFFSTIIKAETTVEDYILQYKDYAINEMYTAKIPASITIAQAILESRHGNSYLAVNGNNHFGIKCHNWEGLKLFRDDDAKNECFRKYGSVYESFKDHTAFLTNRNRYAFLFDYGTADYKNWAEGLKQAGYATDPSYANSLIDIIEKYDLSQYDTNSLLVSANNTGSTVVATSTPVTTSNQNTVDTDFNTSKDTAPKYQSTPQKVHPNRGKGIFMTKEKYRPSDVFHYNNLKTVVVNTEINPHQVARAYGMSIENLCKFNDMSEGDLIPANTKLYLEAKRNQGSPRQLTHEIKEGETMQMISQEYGIKLCKLYKKNYLAEGAQPVEGELIYLRGKSPRPPYTVEDMENDMANGTYYDGYNSSYNNADENLSTDTGTSYSNYSSTPPSYNTNGSSSTVKSSGSSIKSPSYSTNTYGGGENSGDEKNKKKQAKSYYNPGGTNTSTTGANTTGNTSTYYEAPKTTNSKPITYYETPSNNVNTTNNSTYYEAPKSTSTSYYENVEPIVPNNEVPKTTTNNSYPPATPMSPGYDEYVENKTTTTTTYYEAPKTTNTTYYEPTTTTSGTSTTYTETPVTTTYNNTPISTAPTTNTYTSPNNVKFVYTVKKGDTLYNISKRMDMSVDALKRINRLNDNIIKLGQQLQIIEHLK